MAFVTYNPASNTRASLVSAIFTPTAGISLVGGSITTSFAVPADEPSSISYNNAAIPALGIGSGLLLTTGDPTPALSNTSDGEIGTDTNPETDTDLLNTIMPAYDGIPAPGDPDEGLGGLYDVTWLRFTINITDPALAGVALDFVFGSEEFYPDSNGLFPDVAGVYVNGVNFALYHGDALQPVAVTNRNADKFLDNSASTFPIEYNAVTPGLQITAPVHLGQNTIKIAIADTGEDGFDSGLFVSNLHGVAYEGFGIAQRVAVTSTTTVTDTAGDQVYEGNAAANRVTLTSGLDVVDGGAGLDQVTVGYGAAGVNGIVWDGDRLVLRNGANTQELVNVERVHMAGNLLYALDTQPGDHTYQAFALMQAGSNSAPSMSVLSEWTDYTDAQYAVGHDLGDVAQQVIAAYVPTWSNKQVIEYLYQHIMGTTASSGTVDSLAAMVGPGQAFETMGDLYAYGALLPENTAEMAGFIGTIQQLDPAFF